MNIVDNGEKVNMSYEEIKSYNHIIDELQKENAKLRELAKAAWGCINRYIPCDECRVVYCGCTLQSAMRELGVEVD